MASDPYKYFRVEARELIDELGKGVLSLEREAASAELVARLLRHAHTLKGAARVVKQREIADEAHAVEDVLSPYRDVGGAVPPASVTSLLARLDAMNAHLARLSPAEAVPSAAAVPAPEPVRVVRADVEEVDALIEGLAEARVHIGAVEQNVRKLERVRHLVDMAADQLGSVRGREEDGAGRAQAALRARLLLEELKSLLVPLEKNAAGALVHADRELEQVRNGAERLRLVSVRTTFALLERAVRDAAEAQKKAVVFEGRGGELRLDGHVLGALQPALVQIVRNAVAHGIESEGERLAASKPKDAKVTIEARQAGSKLVLRCSDDGRGVDLQAVRQALVARGVPAAELSALGPDEVLARLLRGGLSTAASVTELAGRGVGLDIVREIVERVRGTVTVQTVPGRGTTLEIAVPLSLAAVESLIVEGGGLVASIPIDGIAETVRLGRGEVTHTPEGDRVVYGDGTIPFAVLPEALGMKVDGASPSAHSAVVVRGANGARAAIGVDRLVGRANVLFRPLPSLAPANPAVIGASFDALGGARLALDPEGLVAAAGRAVDRGVVAASSVRVLIIDDSLTTRTLEQSILESAGYEADTATSGEEGLEKALGGAYALFLVDVEMPGMTGFSFVERIRSLPALRDTPAILVTSRNAPEDFQRGKDVGAQGYMVKSQFDQRELLDHIRRLVK